MNISRQCYHCYADISIKIMDIISNRILQLILQGSLFLANLRARLHIFGGFSNAFIFTQNTNKLREKPETKINDSS